MGTTNTPGDLVSPLLGPVQTAGERAARAEAEERLELSFRRAEMALERAGWNLQTAEIDLVKKTARIEVKHGSRLVTFDVRNGRASVTREIIGRVQVTTGRKGDRTVVERLQLRLLGRNTFRAEGIRSAMRFFADYLDGNGNGALSGRQALGALLDGATPRSDR